MDDANFFTQSISSLLNSMFYIQKYKFASGLEINMGKSSGKFFNKNGYHQVSHLPRIKWVENMRVVKINHYPRSSIDNQWASLLSTFKDEIKYYKSFTPTFQAKAIISKSKLLSKLTYMCSVHVMPIAFQNSLNKALLCFLVPYPTKNMTNTEIFNKITKFAAPKHLGGYGVDHIRT